MRLEDALVLIAELQAENATLRERVAAREQQVAAGTPVPAPAWAKANRQARKQPAVPRRRRPEQNRGRPRGEPTQYVRHA